MPILYDKGTRVRVLESSGDKCAGGLGTVVDISDTALFQYTVKVDGERGFRNYRIGEIVSVEDEAAARNPEVGDRVKVMKDSLDVGPDAYVGAVGVVTDVNSSGGFPYRVTLSTGRVNNYNREELSVLPKDEGVASPRMDDWVTVVLEGSPYKGMAGVVLEIYDFEKKPILVEFIADGWLKSFGYFDAKDLEVLKVEDLAVAEKTPEAFEMGDFVEVTNMATTYFGMRGMVEKVRQFANEKYRVQFFEGDTGCWFSNDELALLVKPAPADPVDELEVVESHTQSKDSEESVGGDLSVGDKVKIMHPKGERIACSGLTGTVDEVLPGDLYDYVVAFSEGGKFGYRRDELVPVVEEPGVALIGKTVQIKPGVMFSGEFGTVAGVHDSGNATYHVDFGTGKRVKHYYPLEYLEVVPEAPEPLYVPGGGMDWSDSVTVPIVVPEVPVDGLSDEYVRIRLEDGQVVVEALGTIYNEVRIATNLLYSAVRFWSDREAGANRRTAMDMLDLSGEFGWLPEEDQAVVDSVVEMMKRRDWI